MFAGKLLGRIAAAEKAGTNPFPAIEEEALSITQKFAKGDYESQSSLLLSLWVGKEDKKPRRLFEIFQGIVTPVSQSCLGSGQSVAQGMVAELFRSDMSAKQAALMAVYLLAEAKTYADGCGKESQILMLSDGGSWEAFSQNY